MEGNELKLGEEIAAELVEFAPYFRYKGQVVDYKNMVGHFEQLFYDVDRVVSKANAAIEQDQPVDSTDWATKANAFFKKLEQFENYAYESDNVDSYFSLLQLFTTPFQYLRPIVAQKLSAYHDAERKRVHGTATTFSRIQTDPSVVIEHCADCPGSGQQQQTNLKGPRTFQANKNNVVKSREQQVQEERERLLNTEEI